MEGKKYTKAGTDIEEVKRLNAASGLSYNEVKKLLAQRQSTFNEVDSNTYKLNQVPDSSININSNSTR